MATEVSATPDIPVAVDPATSLEDDTKLLKELNSKPYKAQAVWFLNAFWKKGPAFGDNLAEAEKVWSFHNSCVELDSKGDEGSELDEMKAHILLERTEGALTVRELRERLKAIDLDFNKYVSLTEYLVTTYAVDWRELVHAPQGQVDEAKLALAQQKVEEAKQDIADCETRAKEAKVAEAQAVAAEAQAKQNESEAKDSESKAKAKEAEAKDSESKAKEAEAKAQSAAEEAKTQESRAFQEEEISKEAETKAVQLAEEQVAVQKQVEEALEAVTREEKAFHDECNALDTTANDESLGIVARNKAKNELAQLQQTDPIPLQRAKISQEAVVRRQERATKSAASARAAAESARVQAEEARKIAVNSRERSEEAASQATSRRRGAEKDAEQASQARHSAEEDAEKASNAREGAEKAREGAENAREEANAALQKSTESFQAAQAFLQQVKRECSGAGKGKLWWLDRELEEAKKYMSPAQLARLQAAPSLKEDQTSVA